MKKSGSPSRQLEKETTFAEDSLSDKISFAVRLEFHIVWDTTFSRMGEKALIFIAVIIRQLLLNHDKDFFFQN